MGTMASYPLGVRFVQRYSMTILLLVALPASTVAGDSNIPGDSSDPSDVALRLGASPPVELPLVRQGVVLDQITGARAVYPEFGSLPESPGKDLFLGFHVAGSNSEVDTRGRLRVFPNRGTPDRPRYEDGYWFDDQNPSARIPGG